MEKWNSLAIGLVRYASRSGGIIAERVAVIEISKKAMMTRHNIILRLAYLTHRNERSKSSFNSF